MVKSKRVLVVIRCRLSEPRAGQGLRAAVSYAALGLEVAVALAEEARAADAAVLRHVHTLRGLGHRVLVADAEGLCRLYAELAPDAVIVW